MDLADPARSGGESGAAASALGYSGLRAGKLTKWRPSSLGELRKVGEGEGVEQWDADLRPDPSRQWIDQFHRQANDDRPSGVQMVTVESPTVKVTTTKTVTDLQAVAAWLQRYVDQTNRSTRRSCVSGGTRSRMNPHTEMKRAVANNGSGGLNTRYAWSYQMAFGCLRFDRLFQGRSRPYTASRCTARPAARRASASRTSH